MKNILKGGLGATLILVLFYLAVAHVSSCGNSNSPIPDATNSKLKFTIRLPNDSSVWAGSRPGSLPKVIVNCTTRDCFGAIAPDSASVPSGTPEVEILFTTKDAIPANSVIHLMVYQGQNLSELSKDKKAK